MPFEWLETIPLATSIVRPLVESCTRFLPELLTSIGQRRFLNVGAAPLLVQDTQRILKIARETDDPGVLAGAASALRYARFIRIAEPELILKLFRSTAGDDLAITTFNAYKFGARVYGTEPPAKELEKTRTLARSISKEPERFRFQIACTAAEFLAEYEQVGFPPLLHEEGELNIKI